MPPEIAWTERRQASADHASPPIEAITSGGGRTGRGGAVRRGGLGGGGGPRGGGCRGGAVRGRPRVRRGRRRGRRFRARRLGRHRGGRRRRGGPGRAAGGAAVTGGTWRRLAGVVRAHLEDLARVEVPDLAQECGDAAGHQDRDERDEQAELGGGGPSVAGRPAGPTRGCVHSSTLRVRTAAQGSGCPISGERTSRDPTSGP